MERVERERERTSLQALGMYKTILLMSVWSTVIVLKRACVWLMVMEVLVAPVMKIKVEVHLLDPFHPLFYM